MSKCDNLWEVGTNPLECGAKGVGDAVGGAAQNVANAWLSDIVKGWADAAAQFLKWLNEWWMDTPAADIASAPVQNLTANLSWYTAAFAVLGFLVGLIRLLLQQSDLRNAGINLGRPLFNMVLATGVYGAGIPLLMEAGDGLSKWLLEKTTDSSVSLDSMMNVDSIMKMPIGITLIMVLLLMLSSVVNFAFMIFRNVMFLLLAAFLPTVAAASGTEAGNQAWRKDNGWLLALLLFKPVAAGIFALGIYATRSNVINPEDQGQFGAELVNTLTTLLILVMAALALPALIKFVVPAAAAGGGAFSGGAVAAGAVTVAAGAAVLGSTLGAGAAAGGATAGGATAGGTSQAGSASAVQTGAATQKGTSQPPPTVAGPMSVAPPPSGGAGGSGAGGSAPSSSPSAAPKDGGGASPRESIPSTSEPTLDGGGGVAPAAKPGAPVEDAAPAEPSLAPPESRAPVEPNLPTGSQPPAQSGVTLDPSGAGPGRHAAQGASEPSPGSPHGKSRLDGLQDPLSPASGATAEEDEQERD